MGAFALEVPVLIPALWPAAPGTVAHWVLHAAAAPPVAAGIHAESPGGLERLHAGVPLLVDVGAAPGTVREPFRHGPAALVTVGAGDPTDVIPSLGPAAGRAVVPIALDDVAANAPLVAGPG